MSADDTPSDNMISPPREGPSTDVGMPEGSAAPPEGTTPAPAAPFLLPHHKKLIEDSGISAAVALARGYRSVTKKKELEELGFSKPQCRVPALVLPVRNVNGDVVLHQTRPDEPRCDKDGKIIKYETPRKARMTIDVPSAARPFLGDPSRGLWITEGARKADSAVSRELSCIALLGVWNWRGRNDAGGLTALADWESIALKGRNIFIAFDSDVMTKPAVAAALKRLKKFLESRGANVKVVYLPAGPDGAKVGLDDFFVAGGTPEQLFQFASDEIHEPPGVPYRHCPYQVAGSGFCWNKTTEAGVVSVPLTNFVALIVGDIIEDDGAETRHAFEIEATVDGRAVRFRVLAADFPGMSWVCEHLGSQAVVFAGSTIKDHTRTAIQLLSDKPPVRRVYLHTGWRKHDGAWVYLHAKGAIGAGGTVPGVEVKLEGALARYVLPDPPTGQALIEAVRSTLRMLDLADAELTAPVFAAIWRAPLGPCDVTLHLVGPTGQFKTEVVALAQRHYGKDMDADNLPGSWLGTANSLEGMAFQTKDALFPIDDFVPGQGTDGQRLHREAERLLRAKGNSSGRSRMRADTSLRPPKPPRALLISTGEDTPRGQSLRARMFIVRVAPGAIDPKKLTPCQQDAASGSYALAMAGFLKWLAPKMEGMDKRLAAEIIALRERLNTAGMHRRTPETAANLAIGLQYFLDFAVEIGALTAATREASEKRAMAGLIATAGEQQDHHEANEVTRRFLDLLRGTITSGAAHVAGPDGHAPPQPERWGWIPAGTGPSVARGSLVGWIDGDDLYLDSEAAFAAVQKFGRDSGEAISVSLSTLKRRLKDKGWLRSTDDRGGKERLEIRRMLQSERRSVLHLPASAVFFTDGEPDTKLSELPKAPKPEDPPAGASGAIDAEEDL